MEAALNSLEPDQLFAGLPDVWRRSVDRLDDLHARWRLAKLSVPVALPELFTTSLDLQSRARTIHNTDLGEALRGMDK
jgi:hypothetical protein